MTFSRIVLHKFWADGHSAECHSFQYHSFEIILLCLVDILLNISLSKFWMSFFWMSFLWMSFLRTSFLRTSFLTKSFLWMPFFWMSFLLNFMPLNVFLFNVILPSFIFLNVIFLNVIFLNVIFPIVILCNVIPLNVILPEVMAPCCQLVAVPWDFWYSYFRIRTSDLVKLILLNKTILTKMKQKHYLKLLNLLFLVQLLFHVFNALEQTGWNLSQVFNCIHWHTKGALKWNCVFPSFSSIIEGATKKVLHFWMPLEPIYNKNFCFNEQKKYHEHYHKV